MSGRRRTKADVQQLERIINGALQRNGADWRLYVEWAYGRPRAYKTRRGGPGLLERELSPRLPTGPMVAWLEAFCDGLVAGIDLRKEQTDVRTDQE